MKKSIRLAAVVLSTIVAINSVSVPVAFASSLNDTLNSMAKKVDSVEKITYYYIDSETRLAVGRPMIWYFKKHKDTLSLVIELNSFLSKPMYWDTLIIANENDSVQYKVPVIYKSYKNQAHLGLFREAIGLIADDELMQKLNIIKSANYIIVRVKNARQGDYFDYSIDGSYLNYLKSSLNAYEQLKSYSIS